jgi:GT2 family glycosyltransferase
MALAITLASLAAQTIRQLRIVISDQTEELDTCQTPEIQAILRLIRFQGGQVEVHRHLPRRGMAEQRQFLLDQARAELALFLDDDVILEPDCVERLVETIEVQRCGFVGSALIGLKYLHVVRPAEEQIEFWDGPVVPELITDQVPAWERYRLHSACNLLHVQQQLGLTRATQRVYRVAWVGGCVVYDVAKLRDAGGFSFWSELPDVHAGEDVLAQLRVMARYGGCGLIPSGAFHQDLVTTIADRRVNAPQFLAVAPAPS